MTKTTPPEPREPYTYKITASAPREVKKRISGVKLPKLRAWRFFRSYTISALAERTHMSSAGLSQIETGVTNARLTTVGRLADALGITTEQLRYEDPPVPQDVYTDESTPV